MHHWVSLVVREVTIIASGRHQRKNTGLKTGHYRRWAREDYGGLDRREIPPLRRPTRSQEANAKEKRRPASVGMTVVA
jgi:hypothetical protein